MTQFSKKKFIHFFLFKKSKFGFFFLLVLLSALIERFRVSSMRDLKKSLYGNLVLVKWFCLIKLAKRKLDTLQIFLCICKNINFLFSSLKNVWCFGHVMALFAKTHGYAGTNLQSPDIGNCAIFVCSFIFSYE